MWEKLSGKKTVIGSILLALAVWLPEMGITGDWLQWLSIAGTMFGGVGVVHKGAKGELTTGR